MFVNRARPRPSFHCHWGGDIERAEREESDRREREAVLVAVLTINSGAAAYVVGTLIRWRRERLRERFAGS